MSCFKTNCPNPVIGKLVDGSNSLEICKEHAIEYCEEHREEILALKDEEDLVNYKK